MNRDEPRTRYDYHLQCWIVDGVVVPCGHLTPQPTCYACKYAGQRIAPAAPITRSPR